MFSDESEKIKPSNLACQATPITYLTVLAAWAAVDDFDGKRWLAVARYDPAVFIIN